MTGSKSARAFSAALVAAAALVSAGRAGAAVVNFAAPVTLATDGSNLVTAGTILGAYNYTDTTTANTTIATSPTVDGVKFTGILGTTVTGTTASGVTFTDNSAGQDNNRAGAVPTTAATYPLVYYAGRTGSNDPAVGNFNFTLAGLTIGQTYAVQFILDDAAGDFYDRYTAFTSGGATSALIEYGPYDKTAGLAVTTTGTGGAANTLNKVQSTATDAPAGAQLEVATFTADSVTQLFSTMYDAQGNRAEISAFVISSAVPEPASLGLLGVGAMGLLARRRRAV